MDELDYDEHTVKNLVLKLLHDALYIYVVGDPSKEIWREVVDWIMSDACGGLTDFVTVCEILEIDPEKLRQKLPELTLEHVNILGSV